MASHPFWVGTQAHPELKSRPWRPAPLFREFLRAALARREGTITASAQLTKSLPAPLPLAADIEVADSVPSMRARSLVASS